MANNIQRNTLIAGAGCFAGAYVASTYSMKAGLAIMAASITTLAHLHFARLKRAGTAAYQTYNSTQSFQSAFIAGAKGFFREINPKNNPNDFIPALQTVIDAVDAGLANTAKEKAELLKRCRYLDACYTGGEMLIQGKKIKFKAYSEEDQLRLAPAYKKMQRYLKQFQTAKVATTPTATVAGRTLATTSTSATGVAGPTFTIPDTTDGNGFTITLAQGDFIAQAKKLGTEAVVYGSNENPGPGAKTAERIFQEGGRKKLIAEINGASLQPGETLVTSGCDLIGQGIKHIFHTVGPRFNEVGSTRTEAENVAILETAIGGALNKAMQKGIRSITLIPLSSGIFGCDIKLSIRTTMKVLTEFRFQHPNAFDHVVLDIFELQHYNWAVQQEVQAAKPSSTETELSRMADTLGFVGFYDLVSPRIQNFDPSICYPFCNFWPCPIELDGVIYPHSEAAQNADKADSPTDRAKFANPRLTGQDAWDLGRGIKMSDKRTTEWNSWRKFSRMLQVVRSKAKNPQFRRTLLATKGAYLVEHSPWVQKSSYAFDQTNKRWVYVQDPLQPKQPGPRDAIWADGYYGIGEGGEINSPTVQRTAPFYDPVSGTNITFERGNVLGQILMMVRGEIGGTGIVKRPALCASWQKSGEKTLQPAGHATVFTHASKPPASGRKTGGPVKAAPKAPADKGKGFKAVVKGWLGS